MKLDTTVCQFEMYRSIGWIPTRFFDVFLRFGDPTQKIDYPDSLIYLGVEYVLKDKHTINAHYEEVK